MDYESLNNAILELYENLSEVINNLAKALGEIFRETIESLEEYTERQRKPKYKPVLSLVKPYKQPYLKVRARARTNI